VLNGENSDSYIVRHSQSVASSRLYTRPGNFGENVYISVRNWKLSTGNRPVYGK